MEDITRVDIHTAVHEGPHAGVGGHAWKEAAGHGVPHAEGF